MSLYSPVAAAAEPVGRDTFSLKVLSFLFSISLSHGFSLKILQWKSTNRSFKNLFILRRVLERISAYTVEYIHKCKILTNTEVIILK